MTKHQHMRACDRCGKERIVRADRRNYCHECREQGLRPIANWMAHGACRNDHHSPDWWWPENSDPANSATQRDLCLDYAIQHKENHGIWGGLLPAARQAYANQRRRAV
jgi:hypothetical protein